MERKRDLEERDALSTRLRERDRERKRNKAVDSGRLGVTESMIPDLRQASRQEYLSMRQDQQIALLEAEIRDEKELTHVSGHRLSEAEKVNLEKKEQLLRVAKEMLRLDEEQEQNTKKAYRIPDHTQEQYTISKRPEEKLREIEVEKRCAKVATSTRALPTDHEMWEKSQLEAASIPSRRRGLNAIASDEMDYRMIVPDPVDFVQDDLIRGDTTAKRQHKTSTRIEDVRRSLPIFDHRTPLLEAIRDYQVLIIVGETGSGKSTQIPQYLVEEGYADEGRMVGCTQPRRVAAMSVAARVAQERHCKLGSDVGYSIRFEDRTSEETKIKYMTDGMLLREFLSEPDLKSYSVMMIDEAHERSLHTDILLGLLKDVSHYRKDLRLLISSATVNATKFSEFFDNAPIYRVPGRRFNVDIYYTKAPEANYLDACVVTVLQIHFTQERGDILVFLSGQDEIETAAQILEERVRKIGKKRDELIICPVYANLPSELQANIFKPTPQRARKVVLATNIAETSLTIDGIKFVIDPGFCKQNTYNPRSGLESLIVTPISRASAEQRAGRSGRTSAGKCFRLYTKHAYHSEMKDEMVPEIQRTNLGNVVLLLKSLGIHDLIHFDFLDPPPAEMLIRALEQLYALGALNDLGQRTKLGRMMAEFPVDPMLSKMLIQSDKFGVSEETLTIAAMLGVNSAVFYRPKEKQVHADNAHKSLWSPFGDHLTLLNVYNQWVETGNSEDWCYDNFIQSRSLKRARDVRNQLEKLMQRVEVEIKSNPTDHISIRKAILSGFFYHTAKLGRGGNYKTVKQMQSVVIHPSSCLFKEMKHWVVYNELVLTSKEYMRCISAINPEWLFEIAPHYYKKSEVEDTSTKKLPKSIHKPKR